MVGFHGGNYPGGVDFGGLFEGICPGGKNTVLLSWGKFDGGYCLVGSCPGRNYSGIIIWRRQNVWGVVVLREIL